ncbi:MULTISPECIES: lysozyme family protein [unclassified Enterococcus]|uniref:lysozyme family protein n=1 Tax=unclassified Enterococcus TaxID=2608891 RepID=UPI0013EE0248|nr:MULTISPECIES: lysozyme family protein [unclassified Enterococcus]
MKKKRKSIFRILFYTVFVTAGAVLLFLGGRTYQSVKRVEEYQPEITKAAKKYQMETHENLIKAIILTESKGKGTDLMQSSESAHGVVNAIDNQTDSIDQGVSYLAEMISEAKRQGCDLWTAVQAYNFGKDYIAYIREHGGKNTVELAESYSKNVLSPLLGNSEQKQYRYWRVQSLLYNGGYLYHNGGNMFYPDIVKMNEKIIDTYEKYLG